MRRLFVNVNNQEIQPTENTAQRDISTVTRWPTFLQHVVFLRNTHGYTVHIS